MARRKAKDKITDPFERARLKKLRAAQRREERKRRRQGLGSEGDDRRPGRNRGELTGTTSSFVKDDFSWLRKDLSKSFANKILNDYRDRPYWLSIPHGKGDGNPPTVPYYPCGGFRTADRVYYGFLFREHRELSMGLLTDARRELTATIHRISPHHR